MFVNGQLFLILPDNFYLVCKEQSGFFQCRTQRQIENRGCDDCDNGIYTGGKGADFCQCL